MSAGQSERSQPNGQRFVRGLTLGLVAATGLGLAVTVRGYLSAMSSWDRFVQGPALIGWLTAFVAALLGSQCVRRGALCFVAAIAIGAFAVGGGTAMGRARRCDTKEGRAVLGEVVGLTSAVEPPAVHSCGGQNHVLWPQWSSELLPRSAVERRRIVEFLDQHGLIDLDSSTSFTAAFNAYTIEVEMPKMDRKGEIVVKRARP